MDFVYVLRGKTLEKLGKSSEFYRFCLDLLFALYYNGVCSDKGSENLLNIVLVEPEIPQNAANIVRTAVVTGSRLHLVKPLGFDTSDAAVRKNMKRCGLDYWPRADITVHESLEDFMKTVEGKEIFLATTKGGHRYDQAPFSDGCYLLFGKESKGLPEWLREAHADRCVRIPMMGAERSLNLANSVAIMTYEALRHLDFAGMTEYGEMYDPA